LVFLMTRPPESQTLTIFAAASLTDAFTAIGADFEAAHPGVAVVFNFAGSSTLAAQIAEGAPADVFASANPRQMQNAIDGGRIAGEPQDFAANNLVLITPADNPAGIASLDDLANDGVLLVLAAPDVPVRVYTDTLLEQLAADPAYGAVYRTAVLANLASEEVDVRAVVTKVSLGEADAGIVYSSDITPDVAASLRTFPIPEAVNPRATYPIAVVAGSPQPDLAAAFVSAVLADSGQATLAKWGFLPVASGVGSGS
jgi:molybdate transport system substrate-binding protein